MRRIVRGASAIHQGITVQQIRSRAATGLLSRASDETAFLTELAAAFAAADIGRSLDFAGLRRYWQEGELADGWRRELVRQTQYDGQSERWRGYQPLATLLHALLQDEPLERWFVRGERCALLLAPLLEPVHLRTLLAPRIEDGIPRVRPDLLQQAQAATLAAWAEALCAGRDDWSLVLAALHATGFDARALQRVFAAVTPERWASNDDETRGALRVLAQLQVSTLLLREHLWASGGSIDATWALGLLIETAICTRLELSRPLIDVEGTEGLIEDLLAPLARAAAASPELARIAARDSNLLCEPLVHAGLAKAIAVDAAAWDAFLGAMSESQLRSLWLSKRFFAAFPAQTLRYEQVRWERCRVFRAALATPEAIAWYTQMLDELGTWDDFSTGFQAVFEVADAAGRRELIARHLSDRSSAPYAVLDHETDSRVLAGYMDGSNAALREAALRRLFHLALASDDEAAPVERREPYWSALRGLEAAHANEIVEHTVDEYSLDRDDPARWRALWERSDARMRAAIARACLRAVANAGAPAQALPLTAELYAREPQVFAAEVADSYFPAQQFTQAVAAAASPLRELVAAACAAHLSQSSWFDSGPAPLPAAPVAASLAAYPQSFAALDEKQQAKLLPLLDAEAVVACAPTLAAACAAPGKVMRALLIELVARTPFAALQRSGLLDLAERKARLLVLTGLAQNADPAAIDAIAATIGDAAHDDFSRGLALDALARAGRDVTALDPWAAATLESLQASAAKIKVPAAAAKAWNDEAARLLAPLGESLGRSLFAILLDAEDVLPRRARQILAFLPAAERSDFAAFGVRTWIAENGSDKFNWLLSPLFEYGDERVANDLVRAVKAWMKTRKPKASAAIRLLSRLPGSYGIAQVRELWESRKFSESIQRNARLALEEAAQRQGLRLGEFLEQLVPDFGLDRDGLRLDVGPYAYTARVRGDFSVVVVDPDGKATKTLPRARAGEDAELRGLAENQLKSLAKNLKPVFKQQSQRLLRNLQTGKTWPVAQWRRLFVEHPLLGVLSQSVVWSSVDADGASLARFRPNGSGGTVDAHDDDVALGDAARVRAAHPLEMSAGELAAWKAQFGDYELISPLAQFDIPVFAAEPHELEAGDVARANGVTLNRARFGSLVEKWGYLKGAGEDGAMINEHTWRPDADWHVTLSHSGISVFFTVDEDVTVERIWPRRRGADGSFELVTLGAMPAAFRATLLAQAEALKALAG